MDLAHLDEVVRQHRLRFFARAPRGLLLHLVRLFPLAAFLVELLQLAVAVGRVRLAPHDLAEGGDGALEEPRLTEVEAEYELARKERELAERVAAMRGHAATQAASAKAAEDNAARAVAEQVAVRKAGDEVTAVKAQLEAQRFEAERLEALRQEAAQLEAGRQQAALAAAIQSQAEEQRRTRAAAIFLEGMRLLTPPPPPKMTTCRWFAQNWVCM